MKAFAPTLLPFFFATSFYNLVLVTSVAAAEQDDGEFQLPRSLGFFGSFAKNHRNKIEGRLECVYGHPTKGTMCPPVMNDPMANLKTPPPQESGTSVHKLTNGIYRLVYTSASASTSASTSATLPEDTESALALFSRCLDDPDDPKCRELSVGAVSPSSQVAAAPAHLRSLYVATLSPTTDDCGGNMFDPRFCASSMPSISEPPVESDSRDGIPPNMDRIVNSMAPTERKVSPFIKTDGSETCPVLFDDDALPVAIVNQGDDAVTVKLVHAFPPDSGLTYLALSYTDARGSPTCLVEPSPDLGAASQVVEAQCDASGFAQLDVVAAAPNFRGIQPPARVPHQCAHSLPANPDPACRYHLAVPCGHGWTAVPTYYKTIPPTTGHVPSGPDGDEEGTASPTRVGRTAPDGDEDGTASPTTVGRTGPDGDEDSTASPTTVGRTGPDGDEDGTASPTTVGRTGPDGDEDGTASPTTVGRTGPDGDDDGTNPPTALGHTGPDGDDDGTASPTTVGRTGPDGDDEGTNPPTALGHTGPDGDDDGTGAPTAGPTTGPTPGPTAGPTPGPTSGPTTGPTPGPTSEPTARVPSGPDGDDDTTASPTADPTTASTECVSREGTVNIQLVAGGENPYSEIPVILASRTNKFAILEVFQAWAPNVDFISAIFMQDGEPVCASDSDVSQDATHETPLTYTVDCQEGDWAYMELWVKDESFKPANSLVEIHHLCQERDFVQSSNKMVKYSIVVSCLCSPDAPSSSPSFAPSFSPSSAPSFAPSSSPSGAPSSMPSSAPSSAPSAEIETRRIRASTTEGTYFCSSEDFSCDEGPNYVNICHYTSRIGYRTYCVPAADSEIVRFYATDYCGACTGGYAVDETGDTI